MPASQCLQRQHLPVTNAIVALCGVKATRDNGAGEKFTVRGRALGQKRSYPRGMACKVSESEASSSSINCLAGLERNEHRSGGEQFFKAEEGLISCEVQAAGEL